MLCPSCRTECPEQAEDCFTCGKALFALTQGSLLGSRYEIVSPLGKGGMSRVYRAWDHVLGEAVSIKVLRSELAWDTEMRQRFLHEIRLARRVSHPNVCRIHEYGEDGPQRYISMELLEGVNLKEVLRNRGLSTEEAFEAALQVAEGLHAVHQHGIIHRDLKASNVMIDRQGLVKLMDFGIAKKAEGDSGGLTTPGQVMGTPEYMSPEHARGAKVDYRSDLYALGCLVFEMFTGQAPFRGPTAFATISKHFYEPAPLDGPLSALIPPALVPVLERALAKDPDRRYASAAEMKQALKEAQRASVSEVDLSVEGGVIGSPRLRGLCEATLERGGAASPRWTEEPSQAVRERDWLALAAEAAPELEAAVPAGASSAPAAVPRASLRPGPPMPASAPPLSAPAAAASRPTTRPTTRPVPPFNAAPRAPGRLRRGPPRAVWAGAGLALLALGVASSVLLSRGADPPTNGPSPSPSAPTAPRASAEAAPIPPASPPMAAISPMPAPPARTRVEASPSAAPVSERETARRPPENVRAAAGEAGLGRPTAVRVPPPAPSPAVQEGTLRILVVPWGEVSVDGTPLGTVTLRELQLSPGSHVVRVLHPEYHPLQRKVTIHPGVVLELVLDLAEKGIRKTL